MRTGRRVFVDSAALAPYSSRCLDVKKSFVSGGCGCLSIAIRRRSGAIDNLIRTN